MPNWSSTIYTFNGTKEVLEPIAEGIKKFGFEFNKEFRRPKSLDNYSCPVTVVSKEKWIEGVKNGSIKTKDGATLPCIKEGTQKYFAKKYGSSDWYNWSLLNWGTKWNSIKPEDVVFNGTSITISTLSAWCGGSVWFKRVCEKYKLSGDYYDEETGNDFIHIVEVVDGEVTLEEEDRYFSKLGVEINGIDHYVEQYSYIPDDLDWEEEYAQIIELFAEFGVSLDKLKDAWGVEEDMA